jgi:hypothetical protein
MSEQSYMGVVRRKMQAINNERIQYLTGRVAMMQLSGYDDKQLGDVALELLITRNEAEGILEGTYSKSEKDNAKLLLSRLRDLEKTLISVYLMRKLGKEKPRKNILVENLAQKYNIYRAVEQH